MTSNLISLSAQQTLGILFESYLSILAFIAFVLIASFCGANTRISVSPQSLKNFLLQPTLLHFALIFALTPFHHRSFILPLSVLTPSCFVTKTALTFIKLSASVTSLNLIIPGSLSAF